MARIVAARDREQRKVLFLQDYGNDDEKAWKKYAELVKKYGTDDPKIEVMYARAESLDDFKKGYPRYAKSSKAPQKEEK